jgi:hypothetical protein
MGLLQKIRQQIVDREYYLSAHAEEEMWADGLERKNVEHAILKRTSYHYGICIGAERMICEFCGSTTETRRVKKHHWLHGKLYIIENVKAAGIPAKTGRIFGSETHQHYVSPFSLDDKTLNRYTTYEG